RRVPHPSIFAASTNSSEILRKLGRSISTTKGIEIVAVERIGARYVFKSCRFEKIKNKGVNTREAGSICVVRKIRIKNLLPFILYLASPYAAGTESAMEISREPSEIIIEFFKVVPKTLI